MQSVIGFKKPPNMLWDVSCVALDVSVYLEEEHLWMLMSWRDTQLIRLNQYTMSRYFKVIEHKLSRICFITRMNFLKLQSLAFTFHFLSMIKGKIDGFVL